MNIGDTVKFSYIDTDNEPATRDADTIYFDSNTKKISVGEVKFDGGTVPSTTSADEGKVLKVDSQGDLEWSDIQTSSPIHIIVADESTVSDQLRATPRNSEDTYSNIKELLLNFTVVVLAVRSSGDHIMFFYLKDRPASLTGQLIFFCMDADRRYFYTWDYNKNYLVKSQANW